jgi:hypothetical protein
VKLARGIFLAVLTSSLLALMFSLLPTVDLKKLKTSQGISVFKTEQPQVIILNRENIPDFLLERDYNQRLRGIDWQQPILTIDFLMNPERVDPLEVYKDLFDIVHLGLNKTSNVQEVLARVYIQTGQGKSELGIAMIAKREKLNKDIQWDTKNMDFIRYQLEENFDLTYKTKWKRLLNDSE